MRPSQMSETQQKRSNEQVCVRRCVCDGVCCCVCCSVCCNGVAVDVWWTRLRMGTSQMSESQQKMSN